MAAQPWQPAKPVSSIHMASVWHTGQVLEYLEVTDIRQAAIVIENLKALQHTMPGPHISI